MEHYYHLGLNSNDAPLFKNVKFVIMGGSESRMRNFAKFVSPQFVEVGTSSDRYTMLLFDKILVCSHGMGMPSMSILLHEVYKLLTKAGAKDFVFVRMGTCGGLGVPRGTLVLTSQSYDGQFSSDYKMTILGRQVCRPAVFDSGLIEEFITSMDYGTSFTVGKTMSADCFYEGQGRMDGAICEYSEEERNAFGIKCSQFEIVNFEMESHMFGAFTHKLGIKCLTCCVVLLDRLEGDSVNLTKKDKAELENTLFKNMKNFICNGI